MSMFIWIGTAIGFVVGTLHACSIFRQRLAQGAGMPKAVYFAVWTLALWSLFGAYVLAFWVLGAAGIAVSRVGRQERPAR